MQWTAPPPAQHAALVAIHWQAPVHVQHAALGRIPPPLRSQHASACQAHAAQANITTLSTCLAVAHAALAHSAQRMALQHAASVTQELIPLQGPVHAPAVMLGPTPPPLAKQRAPVAELEHIHLRGLACAPAVVLGPTPQQLAK